MASLIFVKEPDKRIKTLVKKLTHSGETDLDKNDLSELKHICKCKSEDNTFMVQVYKECLNNLQREHSQVRVACVKLIDYLFRKSHVFRNKMLEDFDVFLQLSVAISQNPNDKLKLPPPKKYNLLLQEVTAKTIHQWYSDYGQGYEKLRYAYRYLKEHKLVDFDQFRVRTREDQIKQRELAEKQERIITREIESKLKEFGNIKGDTEQLIVQIESLIQVLLPDLDSSEMSKNDESADQALSVQSTSQQMHAITAASLAQNVQIEFDPIVEVKNSPQIKELIENLKELKKELIDGKLTKLVSIVKTLSKQSDKFVTTLKEAIDLKSKAMNVVLKLGELNIIEDSFGDENTSESGSEDFEDVAEKEDIESYIPKNLRQEYGLEPIDFRHPEASNHDDCNVNSSLISSSVAACLPSSSNLTCKVRLESGKLCPRRDKVNCPFHGKIIERDDDGLPVDEVARQDELSINSASSGRPDWQDPQLLCDIQASIGIDLTMPQYAKKQKKLSNGKRKLENTKTCDVTPKQRLEKRIKLLSK